MSRRVQGLGLSAATALLTGDGQVLGDLGWSALENGDARRAGEAFDGALGCGAADPEALAGKAAALEALGKPADELRRLLAETELELA